MISPPDILFSEAVPSACFVIDEEKLLANAAVLEKVQQDTGVKILLALKAFAAWAVFPLLSRALHGPLWGTCASSVDEARLGREEFGGEVHAFAAAWSQEEIGELLPLADHLVFNSLRQWRAFRPMVMKCNAGPRKNNPIRCGLRLNPEHSEGTAPIYDPCSPGSRLGIRKKELAQAKKEDFAGLSGLHFHTLCEQDAAALKRTLTAFEQKFSAHIPGCQWLNFGGGHHITRQGYDIDLLEKCLCDWHTRYNAQIYLEPGEAIALDAGWLTATVLDIVEADMPVAILDVSAACHMPDVLEMPYTPKVWYYDKRVSGPCQANGGDDGPHSFRLAGKSCLAGDIIGEYVFSRPLECGQKLVFADMAIYSMVKTNTFNGLRLPSIGLCKGSGKDRSFVFLKQFSYGDFKNRLS